MPSTQQVPLADAFRIATGLEPPTITPEQKAEYAAKREEVWREARRIYGDDSLGRSDAA